MSIELKNRSLYAQDQNFPCCMGIRIWIHENPTTVKILKIAGLILVSGLLASLPYTAPALSISLATSLGIIGGFLILASSPNASHPTSFSFDDSCDAAKQQTMRIMEMVKPYFLSGYKEGTSRDKEIRVINGEAHSVERANHGLAHALRQGALAKDIFQLLVQYPITDFSGIVEWARHKKQLDPHWIQKIEMAASFQRSGRQRECSSTSHPELYKKYEMQDAIYFREHAQQCLRFTNELEQRVFEEAILWSNPGTLDENTIEDLRYLRRILHAAHTLDLRRMLSFDGEKVQEDAIDQLFGGSPPLELATLKHLLWNRSGDYLKATGDRDLVNGRHYQNQFFVLNRNPTQLVNVIYNISKNLTSD